MSINASDRKTSTGRLHRFFAVVLMPVVLAAVAFFQMHRTRIYVTTPWKGGGFGMFSTIDFPPARVHRVYLVRNGVVLPVALDARFDEAMRLMRNIPQLEVLQNVGRELGAFRWVFTRSRYTDSDAVFRDGGGQGIEVLGHGERIPDGTRELSYDAVRVEVWRYTFDVAQGQAGIQLISDASVTRSEP